MSASFDPSIESEIRNHAWNYFALHAQQRMSAFQFFITLEIGLAGAVFLAVQTGTAEGFRPFALIGILMAILAFVFWKIDQRTRDLIKNAERSLQKVEAFLSSHSSMGDPLPFSADPQVKGQIGAIPLISGRLTYSQSFGVIFLGCGALGICVAVWLFLTLK